MIKAVLFDFFGVLEQQGASNQPLFEYIKNLKKDGLKLGIISNANEDWVTKILSKEEAGLFDNIIISYQCGFAKPELEIYELALKNLGIKPEQAVFVDDINDFCIAAQDCGMQAVNYRDFEQAKSELEEFLTSTGANN